MLDGNRATVGISEFAQDELGEIAYVEASATGSWVKKGETLAVVDSLKSTSEIQAPVSGRIALTNNILNDDKQCHIINDDPLREGWLCVIEISNPSEFKVLLSAAEYQRYVGDSNTLTEER